MYKPFGDMAIMQISIGYQTRFESLYVVLRKAWKKSHGHFYLFFFSAELVERRPSSKGTSKNKTKACWVREGLY